MTDIHNTAYPILRPDIGPKQLADCYRPTEEEIEWARDNTISPKRRISLLIQLKVVQNVGYFPMLRDVPRAITRFVALGAGFGRELTAQELESADGSSVRQPTLKLLRAKRQMRVLDEGVDGDRGVVERGTGRRMSEVDKPIAGKTGTTNDEKDAWFIGFTPNLVVGLYIGFDQPRTLGKGSTGGGLSAPVFKEFMTEALKDTPPVDFQVPEGMQLIAINRKTGMRAGEGEAGTIMEAFKPGTGPADSYWVIGMEDSQVGEEISPSASRAIQTGSGGLY